MTDALLLYKSLISKHLNPKGSRVLILTEKTMSERTNIIIRIDKKLRDDFKKLVESEVPRKTMSSVLRKYIAQKVKRNDNIKK